jgi:CDP-diglyceride synthetase
MVMTALWAAAAMLVNDVAAVLLVQAEARNRAGLAAIFDSVMWLASIATTTISVTALQGHHMTAKAAVILAVEAANVAGSFIGVAIGRRYIKEKKTPCACGCPAAAKESP